MKEFAHEFASEPAERESTGISPVVALHCSGADGSQWSDLKTALEGTATVIFPDLLGTASRPFVPTKTDFRLKDEASCIIDLIGDFEEPVHLVGHSYGGAVALHIASARPDLVRSLCLYEPTLFSLLLRGDQDDRKLHAEIVALAESLRLAIEQGYEAFSAEVFTDFWGGLGAWLALSRTRQDALIQWIRKVPLDFDALLNEPEPERIARFDKPITILVGQHTHPHTTAVARLLKRNNSEIALKSVPGAGHLGPFTFRDRVNRDILRHLRAVHERDQENEATAMND